jgi:hypothetical protein
VSVVLHSVRPMSTGPVRNRILLLLWLCGCVHRGGGTVCFETPALNAQLSASMSIYGYDSPKGGCQPSS